MHCELSKLFKPLSLEITISCLFAKSQTCLIQVLNMLRTSPRAPFLEPSLVDTYVIREYVTLRVEPSPNTWTHNPSRRGATPWWSELGPQLGESSQVKVPLEGHVTIVRCFLLSSSSTSVLLSFVLLAPIARPVAREGERSKSRASERGSTITAALELACCARYDALSLFFPLCLFAEMKWNCGTDSYRN